MRLGLEKKVCLFLCIVCLWSATAFAAERNMVLYSSNQPEMLELIAKDFEKKTGIHLRILRMGTGLAMKRIAAEKEDPKCDVFWSGEIAILDAAKSNFMPYRSPEAAVLPKLLVEQSALWSATNVHLMVIMANTQLIRETELPRSWKDLQDPKWKGKFAMANPFKSGSAYAQVYGLFKLYGAEGMGKIIANARILDSSSLVYKGTADGEFALGITMEYAAQRYMEGGAKQIKVVYPSDGAIAAPEGLAIVANCQHPTEAKLFVDYLLSLEAQNLIFKTYFRRPARSDAPGLHHMPALADIKVLEGFDAQEANMLEKELLLQWKNIVMQK